MKTHFKFIAGLLALLACSHSHALYRCGNVFQDRPCEGTSVQMAPARPAATPATHAAAAVVSPFAMACARMGKSSLDIIWKREAGALREAQMASPPASAEHKKLVEAVYQRRGSAPEIRAAIEADCIAENQRAADLAAALAALKQPGTAVGTTTNTQSPTSAARQNAEPATVSSANDNKALCARLRNQLSAGQERARQGGSISTMEIINKQRRDIDQKISDAKC